MTDQREGRRTAKLQFHYVKGPNYTEVPCHGVIGGLLPSGRIAMSIFAERIPIPQIVEFDVPLPPEGEPQVIEFAEQGAKPSNVETKSGVVRHIQMTAYLDVETADRLRVWLADKIEEHRQAGTKP